MILKKILLTFSLGLFSFYVQASKDLIFPVGYESSGYIDNKFYTLERDGKFLIFLVSENTDIFDPSIKMPEPWITICTEREVVALDTIVCETEQSKFSIKTIAGFRVLNFGVGESIKNSNSNPVFYKIDSGKINILNSMSLDRVEAENFLKNIAHARKMEYSYKLNDKYKKNVVDIPGLYESLKFVEKVIQENAK